jgi:hypothetical protein
LITVIHERLAKLIADQANLKLLKPPIESLPVTSETMLWTNRTDGDEGHRWLRQQLTELAAEMATDG